MCVKTGCTIARAMRHVNEWLFSHQGLRRYGLIALAFLALGTTTASAQCPSLPMASPQRWTYNTLQWTYSGGLSTVGIAAAAAGWNSPSQTFTTVQAATTFDDFHISDDASVFGLGEIDIFTFSNAGPGQTPHACYLKPSLSCGGICFNNTRIQRATVKMNNNNIGGAASNWAPIWGVTFTTAVNTIVQKTISHELGHFFWLEEISAAANCTNPTIMSINDGFYCAISNPTACDTSAVAGIYSGWSTVSSTCQTCNLGGSCS